MVLLSHGFMAWWFLFFYVITIVICLCEADFQKVQAEIQAVLNATRLTAARELIVKIREVGTAFLFCLALSLSISPPGNNTATCHSVTMLSDSCNTFAYSISVLLHLVTLQPYVIL
jgi:hypothetical protein